MSKAIVPASFRDPAGFVWTDGDAIFRQVNRSYQESYDKLMQSGLYEALVSDRLLVRHDEVEGQSATDEAYKVLKPERVDFISYPYEWSFAQLVDAAMLTLRIQDVALDHGMSLRDASAYNVQFHNGKAVLIDLLSFEALPEGRPWIAYRQFCQHFLAPLALMSYRDLRLGGLLRNHIDGVPLDLASSLLPSRTKFRPSLQLHIHAHARSQRKYADRDVSKRIGSTRFSVRALQGLVASLRKAVSKVSRHAPVSAWSRYYEEMEHYSEESLAEKKRLIGTFLDAAGGSVVWDLGANIGLLSREASRRGRTTICFEMDPVCVDQNYRHAVADGETKVLPLVCDLTNPSPGVGWAHRERASLRDRGPADVVMALALIHHLAIGNNVPLEMVASFFAEIGRSLIIEFVPKHDPMVQRLLASREDVFPGYTHERFERAFEAHYTIDRSEQIAGSERTLYLMRAR